jgi:deoxycytidine triphosphate deaminase
MAAALLHQTELATLLSGSKPLVNSPPNSPAPTYSLKETSVDLTVGAIFVPGEARDQVGGLDNPRAQINLGQGQTAVIKTAETLALPKGVNAIGFPPSTSVSLPGLLTTNPGLIDPEFSGPLHLTVINMGKETFALKKGDRIMRLVFFRDASIAGDAKKEGDSPLTDEMMGRLSHDFLNVSERATEAAKKMVAKSELGLKRLGIWVPVATALIAVGVTIYGSYSAIGDKLTQDREMLTARIQSVNDDVIKLTAQNSQANSDAIRHLSDRIDQLESAQRTKPKSHQ